MKFNFYKPNINNNKLETNLNIIDDKKAHVVTLSILTISLTYRSYLKNKWSISRSLSEKELKPAMLYPNG
jgi:hypothetical protein